MAKKLELLSDEEIEALSDEEKLNRLDLLDFQKIADNVCDRCYRSADYCDGYFSSSCPCYSEWDGILTKLLKAEQDLKYAVYHIETCEQDDLPDEFPLSCLGFFEGHLCHVPNFG